MKRCKCRIPGAFFWAALFHFCLACIGFSAESQRLFLDESISLSSRKSLVKEIGIKRSRLLKLNDQSLNSPVFSAAALTTAATESHSHLTLNLFPDSEFVVKITKIDVKGDGRFVCIGEIDSMPHSYVVLAFQGNVLSGAVSIPGERIFQLQYAGNGIHSVVELEPRSLPPCGVSVGRHGQPIAPGVVAPVINQNMVKKIEAKSSLQEQIPTSQENVTSKNTSAVAIKVMVLYTTRAMEGAGGQAGIRALVDAAVAEANTCFRNSAINAELNLAYAGEVVYPETGDISRDLDHLTVKNDNQMDGIHELRDTYQADLVCLLVESSNSNAIGVAWVMQYPTPEFEDFAFSVVQRQYAVGSVVFAHEIGHNLGCAHDRENAGVNGAFPYSYGHRFFANGNLYRSVMSYHPGTSILHFSNPDVQFGGVPTGVPEGLSNSANNAKTINQTASIAATFRGVPPAIGTQPVSQSVPEGGDAVFQVSVSGSPPFRYQWRFQGRDIDGATGPILRIQNVNSGHAGRYSVAIANAAGTETSDEAVLTVFEAPPPNLAPFKPAGWSDKIVISKRRDTTTDDSPIFDYNDIYVDWAVRNESEVFDIFQEVEYRLYLDEKYLDSWFSLELLAGEVGFVDDYFIGTLGHGTHTFRLEVDYGNVVPESNETDNSFIKTVTVLRKAPEIITQPESVEAMLGETVVFYVIVEGSGTLQFQWYKDGEPISGENKHYIFLRDVAQSADGEYSVHVANTLGSITSDVVTLIIDPTQKLAFDSINYFFDFIETPGNGAEIGDQINLTTSGMPIIQFAFDYFLSDSSGNETGELILRRNDGADGNSPGSIIYRSGPFDLATGWNWHEINDISLEVPDSFTWTVRFNGLEGNEVAYLFLSDALDAGTSDDSYWVNEGTWKKATLEDAPAIFSARVVVATGIPKPNYPPKISSLATILVGRNESSGPINLRIYDRETQPEDLILRGISDNPILVPDSNIVFSGTGTNRTVKITPAQDQTGKALITLELSDGSGGSTYSTFEFHVVDRTKPLHFGLMPASGLEGSDLLLPLRVEGFRDVVDFQFSIHWDDKVIEFKGIDAIGLSGLTAANFVSTNAFLGTLWVSWKSNIESGISLSDNSTLFALRFKLVGKPRSKTDITIDGFPNPFEASKMLDGTKTRVAVGLENGEIEVIPPLGVSGRIYYYFDDSRIVPDVTLLKEGVPSASTVSDEHGKFNFQVEPQRNYSIVASKKSDSLPSQGVTTLDITLIRRHILGISALDSPYKILAADVNGSSSVSTLDITLIRRLILGASANYPTETSWKFVSSEFKFSNSQAPWGSMPVREVGPVIAETTDVDFIGIKLGDVNGSWTVPALSEKSLRSAQQRQAAQIDLSHAVEIKIEGSLVKGGQMFNVPILAETFKRVTGLQFTLTWDPNALSFSSVKDFVLPGLGIGSFGMNLLSQGKLIMSWDDPSGTGVTLERGARLFTLEMAARNKGGRTLIDVGQGPAVAEATIAAEPARFEVAPGIVSIGIQSELPIPGLEIRLEEVSNEVVVLVSTQMGNIYLLQSTENLVQAKWSDIKTFEGDGTVQEVRANSAGIHARYFRVSYRKNSSF